MIFRYFTSKNLFNLKPFSELFCLLATEEHDKMMERIKVWQEEGEG